jgi:L-ascorbate metabolism protein UlaG (beta-lactamase superfamily)
VQNYITFIGHSTLLINIGDFKILTDPNLAKFAFGVPRFGKPKASADDLNRSDLILISHPHKDHLNKPTLKKISKKIPIAIHRENKKHLKKYDFSDVIEFGYWESREFLGKAIKITMVPARHKRTLPFNPQGMAAGFVIESAGKNIYFAGDTAFAEDIFLTIAEKFKIDILLMPIGAYSPHWLLKKAHTNPGEAIRAMEIIGAEKMIPIHWGSFMMSLDTPDKSIRVLKKKIKGTVFEDKILVLQNGETFYF